MIDTNANIEESKEEALQRFLGFDQIDLSAAQSSEKSEIDKRDSLRKKEIDKTISEISMQDAFEDYLSILYKVSNQGVRNEIAKAVLDGNRPKGFFNEKKALYDRLLKDYIDDQKQFEDFLTNIKSNVRKKLEKELGQDLIKTNAEMTLCNSHGFYPYFGLEKPMPIGVFASPIKTTTTDLGDFQHVKLRDRIFTEEFNDIREFNDKWVHISGLSIPNGKSFRGQNNLLILEELTFNVETKDSKKVIPVSFDRRYLFENPTNLQVRALIDENHSTNLPFEYGLIGGIIQSSPHHYLGLGGVFRDGRLVIDTISFNKNDHISYTSNGIVNLMEPKKRTLSDFFEFARLG